MARQTVRLSPSLDHRGHGLEEAPRQANTATPDFCTLARKPRKVYAEGHSGASVVVTSHAYCGRSRYMQPITDLLGSVADQPKSQTPPPCWQPARQARTVRADPSGLAKGYRPGSPAGNSGNITLKSLHSRHWPQPTTPADHNAVPRNPRQQAR